MPLVDYLAALVYINRHAQKRVPAPVVPRLWHAAMLLANAGVLCVYHV